MAGSRASIDELVRSLKPSELAKMIDHTLLKPYATVEDLRRACEEAKRYGFAALYVPPWLVEEAAKLLEGSGVNVGTVIGFPLGFTPTKVKVFEAREYARRGAKELDFVVNLMALKSGDLEMFRRDVAEVVAAIKELGCVAKAILETAYLSEEEKVIAARIAVEEGIDFLKTSTGFAPSGATLHDVMLLAKIASGRAGVKASGGIRHAEDALAMIAAGATRIGTSSGARIMEEFLKLRERLRP